MKANRIILWGGIGIKKSQNVRRKPTGFHTLLYQEEAVDQKDDRRNAPPDHESKQHFPPYLHREGTIPGREDEVVHEEISEKMSTSHGRNQKQ